jgi:hypothetical protein
MEEILTELRNLKLKFAELTDNANNIIHKVKLYQENIPMQLPVKPACVQCCKNCNAYEMTKEEHLENFCSRYCIRMDKLFGWDINKNYCDKFGSKSV